MRCSACRVDRRTQGCGRSRQAAGPGPGHRIGDLFELAATHESLARRAQPLTLYSLSQSELEKQPASFIDLAFDERGLHRHSSSLTRADYLERACADGYPDALRRPTAGREVRRRGSKYAESTIRTHVTGRMCKNSPGNHAVTYGDLERVGRGVYRRR